MLKEILQAQADNNKALTAMLLGRVQTLEGLLTQKIADPAPVQQTNVPIYDPNVQLRNTLETFKMIEELKENMKGEEITDEENPLMSKVMEKLIDKFTEDKPQPQAQHIGATPLPQRQEPSNLELAQMVKQRMHDMDPEEREYLINHVMSEEPEYEEEPELVEEPDPPHIVEVPAELDPSPGQDQNEQVDSLLSGGDKEIMNEGEPQSNGGEAL